MATSDRAEEYVSESNSVLELKLIRDPEDMTNPDRSFKPAMSHQIFGPAETIYGYKDLKIQLYFSAARLTPFLGISYSEVVNPKKASGVEPDNIGEILTQKLMISFNQNPDDFVRSLADESKFKPMGTLKHSFRVAADEGERSFLVYKCETSTIGLIPYHEKLQTFIMWFIDAASYIDVDDEKWQFFLLFEKYKKGSEDMYAIAGFATVYEYYAYPEHIRPRLSQMLVFPPFQRQGLGAELIHAIYKHYRSDPKVRDITVEDSSYELQSVRDFVDCQMCCEFPDLQGEGTITLNKVNEVAKALKINKKQARRIYEILRLKGVDRTNPSEYQKYRLEVKKRLNLPHHHELNKIRKIEFLINPQERAEIQSSFMLNEEHRLGVLDKMYKELEEQYDRIIRRLLQEE